ncbi:MAG: type I glyceraldehyde-3-phosphate dehydrogenase, partial [Planctomycetota bacterium]|nr:type I glyceraldehyde-3-phosphate dehydrogenase [Planctomycetota bacterium]
MAVRVAINGFGRIGRITFRAMSARASEFDIVAINDLSDPGALAHMLKYDSVHGRFDGTVAVEGSNLIVNGKTIKVCAERNPGDLPWADLGVDVALESTGFFTNRAKD